MSPYVGAASRQPSNDASGPWSGAVPELVVAAVALACCSVAAYVLAGLAGAVIVVAIFLLVAVAFLVLVLPRAKPPPPEWGMWSPGVPDNEWARSYWRLQVDVREAKTSVFAYQFGLGTHLEHLFASRLSQRHGINLYTDPEKARRVLCARRGDRDLWAWVDPDRRSPDRNKASGIPTRTLSRLVRRLEQL